MPALSIIATGQAYYDIKSVFIDSILIIGMYYLNRLRIDYWNLKKHLL